MAWYTYPGNETLVHQQLGQLENAETETKVWKQKYV